MSHEENDEDKEEGMHAHMSGSMRKEFKMAMLDKKEKILKAKLEFIGKMRELVKKIPEGKE